jgi:hypothetical protein
MVCPPPVVSVSFPQVKEVLQQADESAEDEETTMRKGEGRTL